MSRAVPSRWVVVLLAAALIAGCVGHSGASDAQLTVAATSARPTHGEATSAPVIPVDILPLPIPAGAALPPERRKALQDDLNRLMDGWAGLDYVKGVTAAVVTADGSWAGAAGRDGAGVRLIPTAMAGIGSVTKSVTAAETLSLNQSGLIDLDAPASRYLQNPLLRRNPTVRQLLSHTSGIPDFANGSEFLAAVAADPTRHWTPTDALRFATGPLQEPGVVDQNDPGAGYSSSNYLLLGLLIEAVTGQTYARAVRRDVLNGFGNGIVVQDAEVPRPPLATSAPASGAPADGIYVPNRAWSSATGAAGGMAANAAALAGWGYRLWGGLVLSPERTAEMTRPASNGYGLGTMMTTTTVGHSGRVPSYATLLTVIPRERISVAIIVIGFVDGHTLDDVFRGLYSAAVS